MPHPQGSHTAFPWPRPAPCPCPTRDPGLFPELGSTQSSTLQVSTWHRVWATAPSKDPGQGSLGHHHSTQRAWATYDLPTEVAAGAEPAQTGPVEESGEAGRGEPGQPYAQACPCHHPPEMLSFISPFRGDVCSPQGDWLLSPPLEISFHVPAKAPSPRADPGSPAPPPTVGLHPTDPSSSNTRTQAGQLGFSCFSYL